MIEIDEISNLVTVDADYTLAQIESEIASKNFTLGYFVVPHNKIRLEEALLCRMKNLYGTFYGELSDLCVSLQLHSKQGETLQTFLTPRQAAGPDWKNFILGSRRALGCLYRASLKIFPRPKQSLMLAIGLAHDIASHHLEQELIRAELSPGLFGRFGSSQVPKGMKLKRFPLILLTQWMGSKDWLEACHRALEKKLTERYEYKWIEGRALQKKGSLLLHENYPIPSWGGFSPYKRKEDLFLAKKMMKALSE